MVNFNQSSVNQSQQFWRKIWQTLLVSFIKLKPQDQLRNPVMFVVYIGSIFTSYLYIQTWFHPNHESPWFILFTAIWLWVTVLFANFAESLAEGKGRAQAEYLKASRREIRAKRLFSLDDRGHYTVISATDIRMNDLVLVAAGEYVPGDGQVVAGIASVDESAITGESAPVIRESGGDRDAVVGGTRLLSDWLVVRISANPGEMFIDKMINLVAGAKRQKTPNEIALNIFLAALTLIFLVVCATLLPYSIFAVHHLGNGTVVSLTVLVSLLVCLAPTTIGGLLSAIGIAGMNRLMKANVIAMSGRAVEAAGDVNILLLDKTGTITIGNRQAIDFIAAEGVNQLFLAQAAEKSSLADDTPEGKSIVQLAREKFQVTPTDLARLEATFIPFTAQTRVSGIRCSGQQILKGAGDAIAKHVQSLGGTVPTDVLNVIEGIARQGGTPLVVAQNAQILGVVHLTDVVKKGIKERLLVLRRMGIQSLMITGDNPLTGAAIAAEAGVDDFLAEATPEDKLRLIRSKQAAGELVAMVGDGTNDAPALAQSDVAVAMNSGTQAAKEAGNMIDLDSDPTKLIEIVIIGKQLLMTRGALTTFSITNDVAKYFAIIPAAFASMYPKLSDLNLMGLHSPASAILSAVIFNAVIIVALIPLALRGVRFKPIGADAILRYHTIVYGGTGILLPFIGIKAIDWFLQWVGFI